MIAESDRKALAGWALRATQTPFQICNTPARGPTATYKSTWKGPRVTAGSTEEARLCEHCLKWQPFGEFRRRSRDGEARLRQCRTCHAQAERQRRANRKGKTIDKFASALNRATGMAMASTLCGEMYNQFGGVAGFATAIWSHYEEATISSKTRILLMIGHFTELNSASREDCDPYSARTLGLLTDEDLERRVEEQTERAIVSNPQLAIAAAARLGWTLIPPDDDDAESCGGVS